MANKIKTALFWSGGKDSMSALHLLATGKTHEVVFLICTVHESTQKVVTHEVDLALIDAQAKAIGLPLVVMSLNDTSNESYEAAFNEVAAFIKNEGIECLAFGDIFLEEVKAYREQLAFPHQFKTVFPLWNEDSHQLFVQFVSWGYKATPICIDDDKVSHYCLGKPIEKEFLDSLPPFVDPCGEMGEYHSFVFDGPLFQWPVKYKSVKKWSKELPNPKGGDPILFYYLQLELND